MRRSDRDSAQYSWRVGMTSGINGLSDAALQLVYRATVVARLTYAASAWRAVASCSLKYI